MRLAGDDGVKWRQDCLYPVEFVALVVAATVGGVIVIVSGDKLMFILGIIAVGVMLLMVIIRGDELMLISGIMVMGDDGGVALVMGDDIGMGTDSFAADGARMMAGTTIARATPAASTMPTTTTMQMSVPTPPPAPPPAPAAAPPALQTPHHGWKNLGSFFPKKSFFLVFLCLYVLSNELTPVTPENKILRQLEWKKNCYKLLCKF